jgi:hypothetical protein
MRTTLNIDDDALAAIRKYAEERNIPLGRAASDLVTRGVENLPKFRKKNGFVIFDFPPDAPPMSPELLKKWQEEDYEDEYRRTISPGC